MAKDQPSGWGGWVLFAGILMLARGVFQVFLGILALLNNSFYLASHGTIVAFNLTAWGWIHIALGAILLTGAASVFSGRWWGRLVGSIMLAISLVANLAFLPAYPIWSVCLVALDIVLLYALIVKGSELAQK